MAQGIFGSVRKLIITTANAATDTVDAGGKLIKVATDGVDALDAKSSALYGAIKAEAFTYKQNAEAEAIEREMARHINAAAEIELDMRRHPDLFASWETKTSAAKAAYFEHLKTLAKPQADA